MSEEKKYAFLRNVYNLFTFQQQERHINPILYKYTLYLFYFDIFFFHFYFLFPQAKPNAAHIRLCLFLFKHVGRDTLIPPLILIDYFCGLWASRPTALIVQ